MQPLIATLSPPVDPERDHVRGSAEAPVTLVEYGDFQCPYCGEAYPIVRDLQERFGDRLRFVFRHMPLPDLHPRAPFAAEAAEAAGAQERFWEMHDSLMADQGRLDDPHLWERCRLLGIDLDRFERDRRSQGVADRVERDFRSGVRAGVMTTPTLFRNGQAHPGVPGRALMEALEGG